MLDKDKLSREYMTLDDIVRFSVDWQLDAEKEVVYVFSKESLKELQGKIRRLIEKHGGQDE